VSLCQNHSFGVCGTNPFFRINHLFLLTLDFFYGPSRVDVFSVLRVPKNPESQQLSYVRVESYLALKHTVPHTMPTNTTPTTNTPLATPPHDSSAATTANSTRDPQTEEPDHPHHDPRLSPLEAEILTEYAKLRSNLDAVCQHPFPIYHISHLSCRQIFSFHQHRRRRRLKHGRHCLKFRWCVANADRQLNTHLSHLSSTPSSVIADGLRLLERKTSLVCTALKSSVYGIVLQQQIEFAGEEG